jgi:hypothetical protein
MKPIMNMSQPPPQPAQAGKQLQLRIVTPELAQTHKDIESIVPISGHLALTTTLSELKLIVCQHLAVPVGNDTFQELDCNCSAARQIEANAVLNERIASDSDALHTLVVVYEDNKVAKISIQDPTLALVQRAAREQLQEKATGKLICAIGGIEDSISQDSSSERYLKLPILAVCSRQSHRRQEDGNDSDTDGAIDDRGIILDLHTSECLVDITVHNKDFTIAVAGLDDCAINGVLTIFAVQRLYSTSDDHGSGKSNSTLPTWGVGQASESLANLAYR